MKSWKNVWGYTATAAEKELMATYDCWDPGDEYVVGCLIEYDDGVPVRVVASDGGEPEDQTLGRNWSWIAGALNKAYTTGIHEAMPS